ncbi:MAG: 50S ribosomal protein L11, partial [Nitrosopumilus sp.]|nr:50S ribosomal protein L11 [Nitrosopumilus sp.]
WAGNISMDAAVKVARAKIENTYTDSLKAATKCVLGTCLSLGVKVEERGPREVTAEIDEGKWDAKFS